MNLKVLFLLDFIRPEYIKDNKLQLSRSQDGKALKKIATSKTGFKLKSKDTYVTFAYPRTPDVLPNGKMKPVTKSQIIKFRDTLRREIIKFNPDLIISFGNVAVTGLYGKGGIATLRGNPSQTEVIDPDTQEVHKYWSVPTYGFADVRLNPDKQGEFNADLDLANRYLVEGEDAFAHVDTEYEQVYDFKRVQEIFSNILGLAPLDKPKYKIVAFDTETNSLDPARDGAKVISISLSWEDHQGVFIPIYKKESPYDDNQREQIINWVCQMLEDTRTFKLIHNAKYDVSFMMMNYGLENANNVIDTMVMHYVGVSEEDRAGRGLKTLAYRYTDMGGYDNELDNFKTQFKKEHKEKWFAEKEATGLPYKKSDYVPPKNEVDGGDFDYDWIPMELLGTYAAGDTDATYRIYEALLPTIKAYKPWINLVFKFYPALINSLARATSTGVNVDEPYIRSLEPYYKAELNRIVEEIHEISPEVVYLEQGRQDLLEEATRIKKTVKPKDRTEEQLATIKKAMKYHTSAPAIKRGEPDRAKFSPSSSDDKRELLYGLMGYDVPHDIKEDTDFLVDVKKKGLRQEDISYKYYKTNKDTLEYLVKTYDSKVAQLLIDYSALNKLYNSYITTLPDKLDSNGRVHPTFNYTGTATLTVGQL